MKSVIHTKQIKLIASALGLALAIPSVSHAQIAMTANDALGNSSFNTAGGWSSAAAPAAGNAYTTAGFLLRSPASGTAYTFAGDSLTVGGGSGGGTYSTVTANNNALIFKVSGQSLTVNNLILDGSQIRDGLTDNNTAALNGNLFVTANSGTFIAQSLLSINSVLSGSGTIYIGDNGNGGAGRTVFFTSGASTFNGNVVLNNTGGATHSRLTYSAGSIMNFMIGANGVNNNISGSGILTLDGSFNFDLSGAGTTVGDSWNIVDSSVTATYDPTFAVAGFTQNGSLWNGNANGVDYQFDTTDGHLSVMPAPEPSTLAICGLAFAGLLAFKRLKKQAA